MSFARGIVIAGGIASGKSTACSLLKMRGFEIIDADLIAHEALGEKRDEIIRAFGESVLDESAKIDRKKLGNIVFSDKTKRKILESITHPIIREKIYQKSRELESQNRVYFVDIPLFFESQKAYEFNRVLLIYAPREVQISRLMSRDKISREASLARINAQMDIEEKRKLATFVVSNTKDATFLWEQMEEVLRKLGEI